MIRRPNLLIIGLICVIVIAEVLILRPTNVETGEETTHGMFNSIESLVQSQKYKDEVGYTIEGFHYTAVEGERKNWEMASQQAVLYQKSRLVHARNAKIKMFDPEGKVTLIEGDEAEYKMGVRDLDLKGNVKVTFPDGFWIKTTMAHYSGLKGEISSSEPFNGEALPKKGEVMQMWGTGFEASKTGPDVFIRKAARAKIRRLDKDEMSDVQSDQARIDRYTKNAYFWMDSTNRYVESKQGTLYVRSRKQEATYDSQASTVNYMTALEDVLIKELDEKKKGLKYATSQKAEFLTREDKILLSGFPSAYQEHDTLTGELIIIYRNKNLVEVTQANAYHDGSQQQSKPKN